MQVDVDRMRGKRDRDRREGSRRGGKRRIYFRWWVGRMVKKWEEGVFWVG